MAETMAAVGHAHIKRCPGCDTFNMRQSCMSATCANISRQFLAWHADAEGRKARADDLQLLKRESGEAAGDI